MTKDDGASSWPGRRGAITAEWLVESVPELASAVCYAAGPTAMVAAMRAALVAAGADEDSIRTEEFSGY
jgi:ferredoxin-NADP reductase